MTTTTTRQQPAHQPKRPRAPRQRASRARALHDLPPTISVAEAGALFGMSRSAAYRAAAAGHLPTIRLGRRLYVPTAPLRRLLG